MGKKIIFLCTILFLLFASSFHHPPGISADSVSVTITGNVVNVREKPDISSSVITQIKKGQTFLVKDQVNDWYEISLSTGKSGWIANWLAEKQTANKSMKIGTVSANALNVRSEASLNGPVIGKLAKGEKVSIISEKNGWSKISFKSGVAWVSSTYINSSSEVISDQKSSASKGQYVTILNDGTNIREKPALKSKIISTASSKEQYKVTGQDGDWYEIEYTNGKAGYVASWIVSLSGGSEKQSRNISQKGIANKVIVIDPGHGGRDQGAKGTNGSLEKNLTMKTAELLAQKIKASGATVVLTRNNDDYRSLQSRTKKASAMGADAFISLHYDSIDDKSIHGHTTYYYHAYEKEMAETINKHIGSAVKLKDRGVRYGNYYVLRDNHRPSILLELGYLSNPNEEGVIATNKYRETVTTAIFNGLAEYFSN